MTTNLIHCIKIIWPLLWKQGSSRVLDIRNKLVQVMKKACWSVLAAPGLAGGGKVLAMPRQVRVEATMDAGRKKTKKLESRAAVM